MAYIHKAPNLPSAKAAVCNALSRPRKYLCKNKKIPNIILDNSNFRH